METFSGMQYIEMDIASSFGLDKSTWKERLDWFENNKSQHEFATGQELVAFCRQAEEPAQALAGILAWRAAKFGQPIGYLCGLDATASGLQLLALLAGDLKAGSICNLVKTGKREDAYTVVHERVDALMGASSAIRRESVKKALMTHLYGSKAEPKKCFGEGTPELDAFYQAVDELLPGADTLNRDLIGLWNPEALEHSWTLPDGFEVVVKVMANVETPVTFLGQTFMIQEKVNMPQDQGLSMGANIIHSIDGLVVREMNRRCNYTLEKIDRVMSVIPKSTQTSVSRTKDIQLLRIMELADATGFLSAAILEYIDFENAGHIDAVMYSKLVDLVNSMPEVAFPVICIHDCFKFHPNYGNDVRYQYKKILAELADSDLLSYIATEIRGEKMQLSKLSNNMSQCIMDSEYAIC